MCKTLLCNFNRSGVRLLADTRKSRVSQKSKIWFLLVLGLFSQFEIFKEFLNNKMSSWCVGHSFVTSIVQALDFWLTHEIPVWAKSLKSEQLKLQNSVNIKKCLFYYSKII